MLHQHRQRVAVFIGSDPRSVQCSAVQKFIVACTGAWEGSRHEIVHVYVKWPLIGHRLKACEVEWISPVTPDVLQGSQVRIVWQMLDADGSGSATLSARSSERSSGLHAEQQLDSTVSGHSGKSHPKYFTFSVVRGFIPVPQGTVGIVDPLTFRHHASYI